MTVLRTCAPLCVEVCVFSIQAWPFAFAWCEISARRGFSTQHIKRLLDSALFSPHLLHPSVSVWAHSKIFGLKSLAEEESLSIPLPPKIIFLASDFIFTLRMKADIVLYETWALFHKDFFFFMFLSLRYAISTWTKCSFPILLYNVFCTLSALEK